MIDSSALLTDLKAQLKVLQADLTERAEDPHSTWGTRLRQEHAAALGHQRTGLTWTPWRDNEVDQAAVAWIVASTFVRFCEDNDLLVGATLDGLPAAVGWIAGPGDRTGRAVENEDAYYRDHPTHHSRDWLQQSFRVLAAQPAGAALVDPQHNPVWSAEISGDAARSLVAFWRRTDADGALLRDFTDPTLDTRFLGDLYQDLSEHAKKTYALLQTPVFVEQFILDRTLTPAIAEFGIEGLKLIDPACGSGHFLLGAFERLHRHWVTQAPGLDPKQRVRAAMDSIHGVDLNPFAVAIARFRLTVAGLVAAGDRSLVGLPALGFHLAIGDSLLGEQGDQERLFDDGTLDLGIEGTLDEAASEEGTFIYDTEDVGEYSGILTTGRYHVVVGNPPYITVKDKTLNKVYRDSYKTAHRQYALSVPFMELFFRLAIRGEAGRGAGYVGQITSNSFMKREFGKKLVEEFFAGYHGDNPVDLTQVIDTSGAYIPGHGTPTVIVIGRRRRAVGATVRAVLGVRGEPGQPDDPAKGLVWTEIVEAIDCAEFDGVYVSAMELGRSVLSTHPWSLSGGGASSVFDAIEAGATRNLGKGLKASVGGAIRAGADEAYMRPRLLSREANVSAHVRQFVVGDGIRDWANQGTENILFPYEGSSLKSSAALDEALWPWRTMLAKRATFQGSMAEAGLRWTEYMQFTRWAVLARMAITFAFVATHNHFVLDRGGKVFNRSAPVIKLPAGASEEQHLELLGVLNSSTACFWLKQVSHNKGSTVDTAGARQTLAPWEDFYEFTGTKLQEFPLPATLSPARGGALDGLARQLAEASPRATVERWRSAGGTGRLAQALAEAHEHTQRLHARLIFEQEELDWATYESYALIEEPLTYHGALDQLLLGQRAFEIFLARKVAAGEDSTAWFERHGSTPITQVPTEWPEDYRAVVDQRLALLASDRSIGLLERPEHKRRWASAGWDKHLREALESAILDRLEQPELWRDAQGPAPRSIAQLADLARRDEILTELVQVLTGNPEPDLAAVLATLAPTEAVPYLAAYRYQPSGLEKFREWQQVWDLQRREDAGEKVTVPVPPKYSTPDFRKVEYWKARGKLDVPKERFVAYPGIGREGDASPVLGWAGWNHRDQAVALVREVLTQQALGAPDEALIPLVAGLVELEPWLQQWHTDLEPDFGTSAAQAVTSQIDQFLARMQLTRQDVTGWRPPAASRGRRRTT